ncbi:MAG: alpha/beta hydrolase-fold protein [Parvularculaceae bacterium]|nr:alpha/beta hydrolase-fold protein [Parvularculaceae bacterium]
MRAAAAFLVLAACAPPPASPSACCTATITAVAPEGAGDVFLTGNLPELGPWNPGALLMEGEGRERVARVTAPKGTVLDYKFTLGSWEREALGPSGMVMANFRLALEKNVSARHEIVDFKKDTKEYIADAKGSGVTGTLLYWTDVASEFLSETRHVSVWLPPGYDEDTARRYKVLYMSDGQNLFDPRIANTGVDWGVDEAVTALVGEGAIDPVIVVGVWSSARRGSEYSPWHGAPDYARFLTGELMPRVNAQFRTLTGPDNTAHMGSSMGGLLSFYLATKHPDVFGACGCLSTHVPFSEAVAARFLPERDGVNAAGAAPDETPYILKEIAAGLSIPKSAQLWFDYGTAGLDADYGPAHAALREALLEQGLVEGEDFVMRRYDGADHNETSWRARLKDPLRFLYGKG